MSNEKKLFKKHKVHKLVDMIVYKRPEGSETQQQFCKRFLEPVFGKPDRHGNYIKLIGQKPNVCFTAHHDTVHKTGGMQKVSIRNDIMTLHETSNSECLGADCTSGIYLILEMIKAKVPGVYVVHAAEEIGCVGSSALVKYQPQWLGDIDAVISFDRKGQESIITHQMGMRTCSDAFAISLDKILGLNMRPDNTGSYTDSNEYAGLISECTNLSVGYLLQHTAKESQDLFFLDQLRDALISAEWDKLVFSRNPHDVEYLSYHSPYKSSGWDYVEGDYNTKTDTLYDMVVDNPTLIAQWLESMGVSPEELAMELDIPLYEKSDKGWAW